MLRTSSLLGVVSQTLEALVILVVSLDKLALLLRVASYRKHQEHQLVCFSKHRVKETQAQDYLARLSTTQRELFSIKINHQPGYLVRIPLKRLNQQDCSAVLAKPRLPVEQGYSVNLPNNQLVVEVFSTLLQLLSQ